MVDHAHIEDKVLTWEQISLRAIFQHNGDLWVKISDRYICRVILTDNGVWRLDDDEAIQYEPSWKFKTIAEMPHQVKPLRHNTLLRLRASPFLFWLIVGGLSSILSLLLLRSLG